MAPPYFFPMADCQQSTMLKLTERRADVKRLTRMAGASVASVVSAVGTAFPGCAERGRDTRRPAIRTAALGARRGASRETSGGPGTKRKRRARIASRGVGRVRANETERTPNPGHSGRRYLNNINSLWVYRCPKSLHLSLHFSLLFWSVFSLLDIVFDIPGPIPR